MREGHISRSERALQGQHLHPVEGVLGRKVLVAAQRDQQAVSHKLNVLAHQPAVHADQVHRQGLSHELPLNCDRLCHDRQEPLVLQLRVQQPAPAVTPFGELDNGRIGCNVVQLGSDHSVYIIWAFAVLSMVHARIGGL